MIHLVFVQKLEIIELWPKPKAISARTLHISFLL